MRVAEPEFAFRLGRDLPARAAPYEVDEILDAVASLHPAIELPNSRLVNFAKVGEFQLVVDDACARDFVLGPPATADWRGVDLARYPVHAVVAGKLERDGNGSNVLGDPRRALTWLVNELSGLGVTLKASQVVTSGTCMAPIPNRSGRRGTRRLRPSRLGRCALRAGKRRLAWKRTDESLKDFSARVA